MSDGSTKYTTVWDGLWNQKHAKKMGSSIFLFGFLLSKTNGKGQVQITYQSISKNMNVPIRTLGAWMQTLKQGGYLAIQKSDSMLIQITNFRSTKKVNFGETVMQDVAEPEVEVMQVSAEPSCRMLPNQLQNPAEPISINSIKQVSLGNPLNVIKIKHKNIYRIFEFWNTKNIITHREFEKFKSAIEVKLKNYTADEIIEAIKTYAEVLHGSEYYFSYRWSLDQFLSRKNGLDRFLDRNAALREFSSSTTGNGYRSQADLNCASNNQVVV